MKENSRKAHPVTLLEARIPAMMEMNDADTDITGKSVPGAILTPFSNLLDGEEYTVRSKKEILNYFAEQNIDLNEEIVSTCEIGLTASILSFCIYYACGKHVPVYDGSVTEWNGRNS